MSDSRVTPIVKRYAKLRSASVDRQIGDRDRLELSAEEWTDIFLRADHEALTAFAADVHHEGYYLALADLQETDRWYENPYLQELP